MSNDRGLGVIAGFFEKLTQGLSLSPTERGAVGPLRDDHRIYKSLRQILAEAQSGVHLPYKQSLWVYAAINAIADNLARVPFRLKKEGDEGPVNVEDGDLYTLFQNPNPYMTGTDLFRATMTFLGLRGECIWILDGREDVTKIPQEIWVFDPLRFEPAWDEGKKMHVGWHYKRGNQIVASFSNWEVVFFRYFNPYDDIRGMAPIDAAQASINQDNFAQRYNTAFFKNGAKVGGYISIDGELSEDAYDRLVKQFDEKHKGPDKAHKVAVIEGGGQFYEAKVSQKDMEFIAGKKMTMTEILAAFKVNEVVLGIYDKIKSQEGIKYAHKAFWEECLLPKVTWIEEVLWSKLFSKIGQRRGKGRIWGEFDLATVGVLQPNYSDKVETATKLFHMGWPINMINRRLDLGFQDVNWGNEWWVPGGFLPVTALLQFSSLANGGKAVPLPAKDDKKDDKKGLLEITNERMSLPPVEKEVPFALEGYDVSCNVLSKDFRSKVRKFFFEQRKVALAAAYGGKPVQAPAKKQVEKLEDTFRKLYGEALVNGYRTFCETSGREISVEDLQTVLVNSSSYVATKASLMSKHFSDLANNLVELLNNYTEREEPCGEALGSKIREIYNLLSEKCYVLTMKDVPLVYAYGRMLAMNEVGSDKHKTFVEPFISNFKNPLLEEKHEQKGKILQGEGALPGC